MHELIELLRDKRSPKRRSAAKKLRKLGNVEAGPALLSALEVELKDKRTWETQYQMIMAIGECNYAPALPFLNKIKTQTFEATMVYVAIGDAIVRLTSENKSDASSVLDLIELDNSMLSDGALRALAMLQIVPKDSEINNIIRYVSSSEINEGIHFWVIAAAPGWSGQAVEDYLNLCGKSDREEITNAVNLAREGKYKKWNPL